MVFLLLSTMAFSAKVIIGSSSDPALQGQLTELISSLSVSKDLEVVTPTMIEELLAENRSLKKKCAKESCLNDLGKTLEADHLIEVLLEKRRSIKILYLNLYQITPESSGAAPVLMRQKSCSIGSKEDLYMSCKQSFLQLIDGEMGLKNLLHPYVVKGPEPLRSCLQDKLPPADTAKTLEIITEVKEATTSLYRPTASGTAELLIDGRRLSTVHWTTDASTIETALSNAEKMTELHQGLNPQKICEQLANSLEAPGRRDFGE
jgi:hypothetical protein